MYTSSTLHWRSQYQRFKGLKKMAIKTRLAVVIILAGIFCWSAPAQAQLARDVQDVFEGMLDELDEELRDKFAQAIKNETSTVEFTPAQFERFRDNPVNPFEGLDNIQVDAHGGNIALKFELPSMRNRTVHSFERQSPIVLSQIQQPVISASASTVALYSGERQIALGTVVKSDGYILTKASEVERQQKRPRHFENQSRRARDDQLVRCSSQNGLLCANSRC